MDCLSPASPVRRVMLMKGVQVGRPLAVDTPIPTPDGWKTMGMLVVDDPLFDEGGRVCQVVGVSDVMTGHPCFELVLDDGQEVVCDAVHR
ncbi:MAG: phage terminase large subunit (GpA) [Xanthobacteraceae bacterium]|nr:MAG: phage terminase large subunit (GpA) [Xanthobacteraceae bacterium]